MNDVERSITHKYWRILGHARPNWYHTHFGWIPLLEGFLQNIDAALSDEQIAHLRIQEIGERRGRLDVVFDCPDWMRESVQYLVSDAAMKSEHVCILCAGETIWSPEGAPCPFCLASRGGAGNTTR